MREAKQAGPPGLGAQILLAVWFVLLGVASGKTGWQLARLHPAPADEPRMADLPWAPASSRSWFTPGKIDPDLVRASGSPGGEEPAPIAGLKNVLRGMKDRQKMYQELLPEGERDLAAEPDAADTLLKKQNSLGDYLKAFQQAIKSFGGYGKDIQELSK
jgi:hypothetical protein